MGYPMEKHITATQAVREFSEILNTIRFRGADYIIERNGKPVAHMKPFIENKNLKTLKELKELFQSLPSLEDEIETFEKDINAGIADQPGMPGEMTWE
jgi:antitoxin (DNA-binding transcriptional repressor) of toxin-antitoxin stability system